MRIAASRVLAFLSAGVALYLAFLLAQYFLPPHIPRFRVETFYIWFVAVGLLAVLLRGPASESPRTDAPFLAWQYLILTLVFVVAVFLQYGSGIGIGFLSDDFVIADWASRREWIHASETGFVRPVVPMMWGLLSQLPFDWPMTLHVVNLLLHAVNAALLTAIASRLGFD